MYLWEKKKREKESKTNLPATTNLRTQAIITAVNSLYFQTYH